MKKVTGIENIIRDSRDIIQYTDECLTELKKQNNMIQLTFLRDFDLSGRERIPRRVGGIPLSVPPNRCVSAQHVLLLGAAPDARLPGPQHYQQPWGTSQFYDPENPGFTLDVEQVLCCCGFTTHPYLEKLKGLRAVSVKLNIYRSWNRKKMVFSNDANRTSSVGAPG